MAEPDLDASVVALSAQVRLTRIDAGNEGIAKAGGIAEGDSSCHITRCDPIILLSRAQSCLGNTSGKSRHCLQGFQDQEQDDRDLEISMILLCPQPSGHREDRFSFLLKLRTPEEIDFFLDAH